MRCLVFIFLSYTVTMSQREATTNEIMEALNQFASSVDKRFEESNKNFTSINERFD